MSQVVLATQAPGHAWAGGGHSKAFDRLRAGDAVAPGFPDLPHLRILERGGARVDRIISVSSMAFDGYPLETALDELAALGVRYVEPASVDKVFQMDLTQADSVDRFSRRLAFARAIGARIVNTIAGPTSGLAGFQANIAAIGGRAADLGLTLALENHGDLVNRGRQIVRMIQSIGIPAVRLNYDTGNAWYYAKGTLDPAEELGEVASVVAHVHLKDPRVDEGLLRWVALGEGSLNLKAVGAILRDRLPRVPVSVELSLRQRSRNFEPRWRAPEVPSLSEIRGIIRRSLSALSDALA